MPASAVPKQLCALVRRHKTRMIDLFQAIDKNADGVVSREELSDALRTLGVSTSGAELDELFHNLDADSSGGIVFRELQVALLDAAKGEAHTPSSAPTSASQVRLLAANRPSTPSTPSRSAPG